MSDIKEFNLIDVRNNSSIVNDLNNVYKRQNKDFGIDLVH